MGYSQMIAQDQGGNCVQVPDMEIIHAEGRLLSAMVNRTQRDGSSSLRHEGRFSPGSDFGRKVILKCVLTSPDFDELSKDSTKHHERLARQSEHTSQELYKMKKELAKTCTLRTF